MSTSQYTVTMIGVRRNTAKIVPLSDGKLDTERSALAEYTCFIPIWTPGKPVLSMHSGPSKEGPTVGIADLSYFSFGVDITKGDPNSKEKAIFDMQPSSRWTFNGFEIPLDTPRGRRIFSWKRTKKDITGLGKWDFQNLKLVDKETGKVVARFTHYFTGWSNRGVFEIEESGEIGIGRKEWEELVILTGRGLLEYLRFGITMRFMMR